MNTKPSRNQAVTLLHFQDGLMYVVEYTIKLSSFFTPIFQLKLSEERSSRIFFFTSRTAREKERRSQDNEGDVVGKIRISDSRKKE